ncbi:MAG: FxLYD domain-containing protein [Leptolyngbyaceae bacterium]|nr:FxLYD domain-containing protein [Leptolyngbyaceae bacterium]
MIPIDDVILGNLGIEAGDPMTMTQTSNLKLAQQGNPEAIAALISRSLKAQNITSTVYLENGRLQIIFESDPVPNQSVMVEFVRRGFRKLNPTSIQTVEVQGKQTNNNWITWAEAFQLINPTAFVLSSPKSENERQVGDRSMQFPSHLQEDPINLGGVTHLRPSYAPSLVKTQLPLIVATILFSVAIVWGCWSTLTGSDQPATSQNNSPTTPVSRGHEHLKITQVTWETADRSRYLIGTVQNSSDQRYPYVQVEFDLYGPVGTQVGRSMGGVEELGPYQSKQFRALVFENQATKAAVKGVYGLR